MKKTSMVQPLGATGAWRLPFGADHEIAGGAGALVIDERAFEDVGLLEILVRVLRDAGARLELA